METRASSTAPKQFKYPRKSLGDVDAPGVAKLIAAASDIALVIDEDGRIHDVATTILSLQREDAAGWIGKNWFDVITPESRPKAELLIKDALDDAAPRSRELNHTLQSGGFAPVSYTAAQLGAKGRIVALGRDLSAPAALQQRLVAAQVETEREYARLRQSETRFAVLFESSSEAMLIVAPSTYKIVEINAAAVALSGKSAKRLLGRSVLDLFDPAGGREVMTMLATVHGAGQADEARAMLIDRDGEVRVSADLFRQERGEQYLVRLVPAFKTAAAMRNAPDITAIAEASPDAFVIVDEGLRIVRANSAFLDMAQIASLSLMREQPVERWLGRPGIDLDALVAVLKQHGFVRNFNTILRGARGRDEEVEISAVTTPNSEESFINIAIRPVPRRRAVSAKIGRELPQSVEQMTELVGRVPLKEMVREATDWIERLSIEAALIVTGDNRASAADMLGFSRQSLYMKMRRYGLGESEPDDTV